MRLNTGTTTQLKSVFFYNASTGWACGLEQVIKTTNEGVTWSSTFVPGAHRSIAFADALTGYMCSEGGRLFKTVDGGANWTELNSGVTAFLNQVKISASGTVLISGNSSVLLRSVNGGMTWQDILTIPDTIDFFSAQIINESTYILSGNGSTIVRTTDSGNTWENISADMPNPLFAVEFVSQTTGWVTGCCGMFMKTTDGGKNWTTDHYLTPGYTLFSMHFANASKGWLTGEAGYILRTSNGGITWDSLNSGTQYDLYSMSFINDQTGYVSGYNGLVLKTTNGGGTGTPIGIDPQDVSVAEFSLNQNFPNPFNPKTIISYELQNRKFVEIKVYDVSGTEVAAFINDNVGAGSYSLEFDGRGLASGVYFYVLLLDGIRSAARSMMLLK